MENVTVAVVADGGVCILARQLGRAHHAPETWQAHQHSARPSSSRTSTHTCSTCMTTSITEASATGVQKPSVQSHASVSFKYKSMDATETNSAKPRRHKWSGQTTEDKCWEQYASRRTSRCWFSTASTSVLLLRNVKHTFRHPIMHSKTLQISHNTNNKFI